MMKKFSKKCYYVLEYYEVDKLIQEYFNKPDYECVASQEWCNYSAYTFRVVGKVTDTWNKDAIAKFKNNADDHAPLLLFALLDQMAEDGKIPEGDYLIKVSW